MTRILLIYILKYLYLDFLKTGLAKISTHSTSWQFKSIKLVQRPLDNTEFSADVSSRLDKLTTT